MDFDPIIPLRLGTFPFWHLPVPSQRIMTGDHPSSIHGFGEEISEIREMEPGESPEWYSPVLSARMKKRMAVYHVRDEEVSVQFFLDASPAIDFGTPSKRFAATKIISSLAQSIFCEPNQGTASFIGVGARTISMNEVGDQAVASTALRRFMNNLEPYSSMERSPFPKVLKQQTSIMPEQLVCIVSDFLIHPENETEWGRFESAYKRFEREGSEGLFIRVLSPLECSMPNGSVTVRSGAGAQWSGWGTQKGMERIQREIRLRLARICSKPQTRFIEIIWDGDEARITAELQEFLHGRTRHLRLHLDTSSL